MKWVKTIQMIVKENSIDVVHILDGDSIMRFLGYGLHSLKVSKIVITYHHYFSGIARIFSYRMLSSTKNRISVVHTQGVKLSLERHNIGKIELCEYPAFEFYRIANKSVLESKKKWRIPHDIPTIGIIGGMSEYKNILLFLKVMERCSVKFHLLICGKEIDIKADDIRKYVGNYSDRVTTEIRMLSEDEYESAIVASDIIFCIYGLSFDGASGPLTDGVCANKMIVSCQHGSLGQIVNENNLGITVDSSDEDAILTCMETALKSCNSFKYDRLAQTYRSNLAPEQFQGKYSLIYND